MMEKAKNKNCVYNVHDEMEDYIFYNNLFIVDCEKLHNFLIIASRWLHCKGSNARTLYSEEHGIKSLDKTSNHLSKRHCDKGDDLHWRNFREPKDTELLPPWKTEIAVYSAPIALIILTRHFSPTKQGIIPVFNSNGHYWINNVYCAPRNFIQV